MFGTDDELLIKYLGELKKNAYCKREIQNNIESIIHKDIDADRLMHGKNKYANVFIFLPTYFVVQHLRSYFNCGIKLLFTIYDGGEPIS